MKNRIKYITAVVVTVSCMLVGLFMPQIICKFQDEKIALQIKNEKFDSTNEKATLIDKLRLVQNGYSAFPLETGLKMASQEAVQAAITELKTLFALDFEAKYTDVKSVFFAFSNDARTQSVFWEIYLETDYSKARLIIDDETKKILSFIIDEYDSADTQIYDAMATKGEDNYELNDKLVNHCAGYYGLQVESIERAKKNYSIVTFKDGSEEVRINVNFSENSYAFNF